MGWDGCMGTILGCAAAGGVEPAIKLVANAPVCGRAGHAWRDAVAGLDPASQVVVAPDVVLRDAYVGKKGCLLCREVEASSWDAVC